MQSHQPECRLGDATFFDSLSMSQCTVTWKGCRSGPHPPECFQLDMTVECTGNQAGVCLSGSAGLRFTLRQYADIILQSFQNTSQTSMLRLFVHAFYVLINKQLCSIIRLLVAVHVLDMKTLRPTFIPCLAFEPIACAVQYLGNAVNTRSQYLGCATSRPAFACMPAFRDFSHAHSHTQGIGNLVLCTVNTSPPWCNQCHLK